MRGHVQPNLRTYKQQQSVWGLMEHGEVSRLMAERWRICQLREKCWIVNPNGASDGHMAIRARKPPDLYCTTEPNSERDWPVAPAFSLFSLVLMRQVHWPAFVRHRRQAATNVFRPGGLCAASPRLRVVTGWLGSAMMARVSDSEWAKAAVLDASYLSNGRLDIGVVERLAAGLKARGAELWIPEVVVLEFAVHAWEDLTAERRMHKRLRQAGLVEVPLLSDLDSAQIADEFVKKCADFPGVIVIGLTGESAMAGLRDQILGTGPGSVKTGVRTGAADSAWVRSALDQANNQLRLVVFLSLDEPGVTKTALALGHAKNDIQIWKQPGAKVEDEMLDKFFGPAPASPEPVEPIDVVAVLRIITASLKSDQDAARNADDHHGPPPEWIEVSDVSIGGNHDWGDDEEIETMMDPEAEVEPDVELVDVAVTDVYAANEDGTGVMVDYTVRLLADVRVEGQKINNDGEGYWDWVILRDRLLTVPYTAELRDGALLDITQTGIAENDTASPRFDDNYDAYQWLYTEELSMWQHITVHPLSDSPELPEMFELRGPDGRVEMAELNPPADLMEDWTLGFETTGASVNATFDHTARAALGRHDSFDVFQPGSLHSSIRKASRSLPGPYTALAEIWAYLIGASDAR